MAIPEAWRAVERFLEFKSARSLTAKIYGDGGSGSETEGGGVAGFDGVEVDGASNTGSAVPSMTVGGAGSFGEGGSASVVGFAA